MSWDWDAKKWFGLNQTGRTGCAAPEVIRHLECWHSDIFTRHDQEIDLDGVVIIICKFTPKVDSLIRP